MDSFITLRKAAFIILVFLSSIMVFSQLKNHALELIDAKQKIEKRNVVILLYTDWCNYCKVMQAFIIKDKVIKNLLQEKFYFVILNGEEKEVINFAGQVFKFQPTGVKTGYHQLPAVLGSINGQVSYPTLVILNPENEVIFRYSDFLNANELSKVLVSFDGEEC